MKRDMELMRKILFAIEEQYEPGQGFIFVLRVEGYGMTTIAEHCSLLYQANLVQDYEETRGGDMIQVFRVGNLTSAGYDYLELIRNDKVWKKTQDEIKKKELPASIELIAKVAGVFTGNVLKELNS
ncbi:MAG: DUF2513 domain-containing protein [Chloroflexota bacterium]